MASQRNGPIRPPITQSINQSIEWLLTPLRSCEKWKTETQNPIAFLTVKPSTPNITEKVFEEEEDKDEYMELRCYRSQTYQRYSLLRRQFHQSSGPQSHSRVFPLSISFRVLSIFLFNFLIHFIFYFLFSSRKCTRIEIHLLTAQGLQVYIPNLYSLVYLLLNIHFQSIDFH